MPRPRKLMLPGLEERGDGKKRGTQGSAGTHLEGLVVAGGSWDLKQRWGTRLAWSQAG